MNRATAASNKAVHPSTMTCCMFLGSCFEPEPPHASKKNTSIITNTQPFMQPRPVVLSTSGHTNPSYQKKLVKKKSFASTRTNTSERSRFCSDGSSSKPLISAPSEFRHVETADFQFLPDVDPSNQAYTTSQLQDLFAEGPCRPRPLQLSFYDAEQGVSSTSPTSPHFHSPTPIASMSGHDRQLSHQRSWGSMSFHIPRRLPLDNSSASVGGYGIPPQIPSKSKFRSRAYTSPEVDAIRERVATAMMEVERLQKQIDDVIERQSLYVNSRPSTSQSMALTLPPLDFEPLPSIPAFPPAAQSFAERLRADLDRPPTALIKSLSVPCSLNKVSDDTTEIKRRPSQTVRGVGPLPTPPLPLVLRPPLRKKKSFPPGSTRLPSVQEQGKTTRPYTVTSMPKAVKGSEGFYQIISANGAVGQASCESIDSISTWGTEDEERAMQSAWSPESTPSHSHDGSFSDSETKTGQPDFLASAV
ncbi:uncharacterized protein UV8b_00937 [Ustilaginoidea virens]|uniref:Acid phosphatase-like protein n=1 Tax=Ustilaginoidea virens TaxID=1159556 RepID=A0A8E5MDV7_USTVR|nr:uncharacterized protein UV8b_00937 [Ustilaginoidea virens]QUC16696.1 hypothetical protein UV8b_00937 [Ustilaginoidea virens]